MSFPKQRPRRLRDNPVLRTLIRENKVVVEDLIYPLFVVEGSGIQREISSMPNQFHFSIDRLLKEAKEIFNLGIQAVLLFGIPEKKDEIASLAYDKNGIIQKAVQALKKEVPHLLVITDVCLCEYTSHGHCGVVKGSRVDNDASLELLAKTALSHAEAGADMVAPSDMMDGRVGKIRSTLDQHGFTHIPIMAYSTKYASAFYGPFRQAADSAPQFGDRRGYQMDPANAREALLETQLDVEEGADILMVKPALTYMDIIRLIREKFNLPLATYNVSAEYSMVKAAAQKGWINEKQMVFEILTSFKRAGADLIITYHAKDAANWLKEESNRATFSLLSLGQDPGLFAGRIPSGP